MGQGLRADGAEFGDRHGTAALLDLGAVVDTLNASGRTPLHLAAMHCCTEVIPLLFEAGAGPNTLHSKGPRLSRWQLSNKGLAAMEAASAAGQRVSFASACWRQLEGPVQSTKPITY